MKVVIAMPVDGEKQHAMEVIENSITLSRKMKVKTSYAYETEFFECGLDAVSFAYRVKAYMENAEVPKTAYKISIEIE